MDNLFTKFGEAEKAIKKDIVSATKKMDSDELAQYAMHTREDLETLLKAFNIAIESDELNSKEEATYERMIEFYEALLEEDEEETL